MALRKPRNTDQVTPPQWRPPTPKVPDLPVVGVESLQQVLQLGFGIGPQARDDSVKCPQDRPGLGRSEMVECGEDCPESVELRGHCARVYASYVLVVRIQVREQHGDADS